MDHDFTVWFSKSFGLFYLIALSVIIVAYAYPIWQHLQMERFGSPGFSPF